MTMGIKEYATKKAQQIKEYKKKQKLKAEVKYQSQILQEKLEREKLREELKEQRLEMKELKAASKARKELEEIRRYKQEERIRATPLGKAASKVSEFAGGLEFSAPSSKKSGSTGGFGFDVESSGSLIGGDFGGSIFGSSPAPSPRKRKSKSSSKKKSKSRKKPSRRRKKPASTDSSNAWGFSI